MFSLKIRYTLYGMILSASLITLIAQANSVDGVFGIYFRNMINTACSGTHVVTGFDDISSSAAYGTKICTALSTILGNYQVYPVGGNVGIGTSSPSAKLQVIGMVKSSPTTIADSSDTLTTRSYVDAGLIDMCTKIGGTWDVITNKCIAIPSAVTYSWQMGSYGACSVSCGPGTQTAPYVCKNSSNVTVADSFCTGGKPAAGSQSCNNGPCAGNSCNSTLPTCNPTGCTLTYSPSSANQSWNKNAASCGYTCNANYSDATCSTYTAPVTYSWSDGGYGACSQACGGGTMYKSYYCMLNGVLQPDLACINAGLPKPSASQACNTQNCLDCAGGGPGYWGGGCSANWPFTPHNTLFSVPNTALGYVGNYSRTCVNGGWPLPAQEACAYVGSCAGSVGFVPVTAKCTMMWSDATVGNTATILYQGTFGIQFGTAKCTSPGVWGEYDATMLANCL